MTPFLDRGALVAAGVGAGVALVVGVSFLLIIPVEPVVWLLALPAGALIGWYANVRSQRTAGPTRRVLVNGLAAAAVTALTTIVLMVAVKALFFAADGGYPAYNRIDRETGQPVPPFCDPGAGCVYQRYVDAQSADLERAGVTDAASFTRYYWDQQLGTIQIVAGLTLGGGLLGALAYDVRRRRATASTATAST
ncbi:MAG: hypothetical protein L0221_12100 [Chloroflexi bacterium]|nr:hypothetical protein [Chloroflexota bacterium]